MNNAEPSRILDGRAHLHSGDKELVRQSSPQAKLVASVLLSSPTFEASLLEELIRAWGDIDFVSERMPFTHTRYYEVEMGPRLYRRLVSFRGLVPADALVQKKLQAQALEGRFRNTEGNRRCNLDPGLLCLNNFVLATHKGYTHRIYLGQGVYGDLTLVYRGGVFCPLEWTYPDYAAAYLIDLLNVIRSIFRWQRRCLLQGGEDAP